MIKGFMDRFSMAGHGKYIVSTLASINKFPLLRSSISIIIKSNIMMELKRTRKDTCN